MINQKNFNKEKDEEGLRSSVRITHEIWATYVIIIYIFHNFIMTQLTICSPQQIYLIRSFLKYFMLSNLMQ